ncbi:MAG: ABC transporter [Betaproteobacteria bacterium HGW-Betaproteobacteria-12]|nr:MAG: ABC transporter [Betaproteobacteria bacterium HGW-Betaproteobacteria-12]
MSEAFRSSFSVTLAVWRALFLHEALIRISGGRARWFWLLADPLAHMAFLAFVLTAFRSQLVAGMDTYLWIVVGLVSFFLFRRAAMQGMHAIDSNKAMFAYRQVKPVDTVFVRAALETFVMLLTGLFALVILRLLDRDIMPGDPLLLIVALFGIWLLALGIGLIFAVPIRLVQESAVILNFLFLPLYLVSGVILPVARIPFPYQEWLLYNPLVHGLEAARLGFAPGYLAIAGLDLNYLYAWGVGTVFIGLALQLRFSERLIAQ